MEKIYGNYNRAELDRQYNLREWFPEHPENFKIWARESARVRDHYECRLDVPYGDSAGEKLNYFPAGGKEGAPLQLFIHGGYWQALDKSDNDLIAEPLVNAGSAVANINYDLAPGVNLDTIAEQVMKAVAWCHQNHRELGFDPERIYVSGHSAGGHLVGMLMSADWISRGLPKDLIKGGCAISGLFDLEPIRLGYHNEVLNMDEAMARRNSPLIHIPEERAPLILTWGGLEPQEFARQAKDYGEAWRQSGFECLEIPMPAHGHFDIIESLLETGNPIMAAIMNQMGLSAA